MAGMGGQTSTAQSSAASKASQGGFAPVFSNGKRPIEPIWFIGGVALVGLIYLIGRK